MTLPTNRELRELLTEATPGPWRADEAATCECCTHVRASATLVCTPDMTDAPLIALAPQLAEEVIRLRDEIEGKTWLPNDLTPSEARQIAYSLLADADYREATK